MSASPAEILCHNGRTIPARMILIIPLDDVRHLCAYKFVYP